MTQERIFDHKDVDETRVLQFSLLVAAVAGFIAGIFSFRAGLKMEMAIFIFLLVLVGAYFLLAVLFITVVDKFGWVPFFFKKTSKERGNHEKTDQG